METCTGVGLTTPRVNIFSTLQESLALQIKIPIALNSTNAALGENLANAQILGRLAELRAKREVEHMSTPEVARDMLNIAKAHGMDKLQYWGFS